MNSADWIKQRSADGKIGKAFIIAEVGVNHEGSMDLAKRLIDEAKEGGAHAVKFQSYKAETIAVKNSPAYWDLSEEPTTSQFELFKKHDKFWKSEFEALKTYCDKSQIEFLSTPFDFESADFLNDLQDSFKISSSDLNNHPFITHICKKGKPIILSTGASHLEEVKTSSELIAKHNVPQSLLHCILNYPTEDGNAHLGMISQLRKTFPSIPIGYSDHTLPKEMESCYLSVVLGSVIVEKHFTHDKTLPGNDHYHAMDKNDLKRLNEKLETFELFFGGEEKFVLESEQKSRKYARRSVVAARDIKQGEMLSMDAVTFKRPGTGLNPAFLNNFLGKRVVRNIQEDEILQKQDFIKE